MHTDPFQCFLYAYINYNYTLYNYDVAILGNRNPIHMEMSKLWSCSVDQSLYCSVCKFCSYTHTHTQKNSIPAGFDHTILVYPSYGTCNQTLPATPTVIEMSACINSHSFVNCSCKHSFTSNVVH